VAARRSAEVLMAKFQHYKCPECGGVFKFLHERSDTPPPDRCLLCDAWVSEDEPVFVPQAPRIKKSHYTKSVDQTYRNMESASIERAEEAAGILESEYAAQPKDEHDSLVKVTQREEIANLRSDLKITNMRDPSEMREGDTAHIPKPASVTGASFQPYAGSVSGSAVSPMAGFIQKSTTNHTQRAVGMIRAGNMGADRK
jgi:hypothetical protein